ncbi:MAG TPA: hypothetical protein ENK10_00255 [Acidobacteria bacterium]|nr:hypothetical protein [Acidobacteriota bacterium]
MKKIVVLLLLAGLAGFWALAADVPAGKEVLKLQAKMGTVTFKHKEHATRAGDCKTCHHKLQEGATPRACSECHDKKVVKDEAPKLKNALHKTCGDCHAAKQEAGEKAGPLTAMKAKQCKKCHVK